MNRSIALSWTLGCAVLLLGLCGNLAAADLSARPYLESMTTGEVQWKWIDGRDHFYVAARGVQVVVERLSLDLETITLNGQTIDPASPKIHVDGGQTIQGTVRVAALNNNYTASHIIPLAWTPSWGDHAGASSKVMAYNPSPEHTTARGYTYGEATPSRMLPTSDSGFTTALHSWRTRL